MTPEILFGSGEGEEDEDVYEEEEKAYDGVVQYLTVNGSQNLNRNTASRLVLEAVMGIEMANRILRDRESGPLSRPIKGGQVSSAFFTIISTGFNADATIKRTVKAVLEKKVNEIETVYWNDNFTG